MIVFGSENEINDVLRYFRPNFPEQHFGEINSECFYVINEVPITIGLIKNGEEVLFAEHVLNALHNGGATNDGI